MEDNEDPLAPARGVIYGTVFGCSIWSIAIALGVIVYKVLNR